MKKMSEQEQKPSLASMVAIANSVTLRLAETGGEIDEELEGLLALTEKMPAKVEAYAFTIDSMKLHQEHYATQAKKLLAMAKACESVVDRMKSNIRYAMEELGTDELSGFDTKFKLVRGKETVVITNEELIDPIYKKEKVTVSINKAGILDDIKHGHAVPGAHVEPCFSLRQLPNSPAKRVTK